MSDDGEAVERETARIAALRLVAMGAPLPLRPPLDPAHVEVLRGMLRREQDAARRIRAKIGDPECPPIDDENEARIAALTAVLGREPSCAP